MSYLIWNTRDFFNIKGVALLKNLTDYFDNTNSNFFYNQCAQIGVRKIAMSLNGYICFEKNYKSTLN